MTLRSVDLRWTIGFAGAALLLYLTGLGQPALRDFDEGYYAGVALAMARDGLSAWWHPTLWGAPFDKPPFVHGLMALSISVFGPQDWAFRLPGALLAALSVPLFFRVARLLHPDRQVAITATLVFLTLLPVVRHGRLAMLDGPIVFFMLAMTYCALRASTDTRWAWPAAAALAVMALIKGFLGLTLGFCVAVFALWSFPRLARSVTFWIAPAVGLAVAGVWFAGQMTRYGGDATSTLIWLQGFGRVFEAIEGNSGPPWYYVLEIVKFSAPWLLFLPAGLVLAWRQRDQTWARFVLVYFVLFLAIISTAATKLPWYVYPAYPAFALACGAGIVSLQSAGTRQFLRHRRVIAILLLALVPVLIAGAVHFAWIATKPQGVLALACICLAGGLLASGWALMRASAPAAPLLAAGLYLGLLWFVQSPDWNWEVNESFPAPPVAALVRDHVPPTAAVYLLDHYERPSLNFYARRRIARRNSADLTGAPAMVPVYLLQRQDLMLPSGAETIALDVGWRLAVLRP